MKILVKIGGTLLDSAESRTRLASELSDISRNRHRLVIVHGGGKQMTRFLAERGIESEFVGGLRVTTPEVIDAMLKVLAGTVNQELVAALIGAGARAVGLTGIDDCLAEADQMDPRLGAVGRVRRASPDLMELLADNGYVPVIACVAGDRQGRIYNINADQMAVSCAAAFGAERLVFLTDVVGVLDAEKRLLPRLTVSECRQLILDGVAKGGMQAKLNAAADALEKGVGEVLIAPGAEPLVLQRLLAGEALGSQLVTESPVHD